MNASDANVSTASTTARCGGLPASRRSPRRARLCQADLLRLDRAIAREAAIEQAASSRSMKSQADQPCAEGAEKIRHWASSSSDARLNLASRLEGRADGATAFFLFHYLRLLGEQVAARARGRPLPAQVWAMPDWSPESPSPRSRVDMDRPPSRPPVPDRGNIALSHALTEHES
jgi:hypothetical protein